MGDELPPIPQAPGLKPMRSFCLRANEIDGTSTDGAIVAYYCRCYGMQKVMAAGGLSQADKMELLPFMDALEKNKEEVRQIGISEPKQGAAVVARYARNVFDHADTADRSNTADGHTVKAFMAAVCFMDTMNYFQKELGDAGAALLAEAKIKREHALYRANVIAKALKAGTPVPPPKGESGDAGADLDSMFASMPAVPGASAGAAGGAAAGLGLPPPAPAPAPYTAPAPAPYMPPAPAPAPAPPPSFAAPAPMAAAPAVAAGVVSAAQQQEAQRHAKLAEQALKYNDVPTAVRELRAALATLGES